MLRSFLSVAAIAAISVAAAALAPACSGSSGSSGSTSGYCADLSSYAQKCNLTDPCTQATVRDCSKLVGSLSTAAVNAAQKCYSGADVACQTDGGPATAAEDCYANALATAPVTAAQQKLAQDYCNACAASMSVSTATCVSTFYATSDGGSSGFGAGFLTYSDSIVSKIDQTCTPSLSGDAGPLGCSFDLLICAGITAESNTYVVPECQPDGGTASVDGG